MAENAIQILGMMSGTSLDGLDLALVHLEEMDGHWTHRFLKTGCTDYTSAMRQRLEGAIRMPAPELLAFHAEYGKWLDGRMQLVHPGPDFSIPVAIGTGFRFVETITSGL